MIETVFNFIQEENLISEDEHVTVALSGGADSIALLHLLVTLKDTMSLTIAAIHIHHGLRVASDGEAAFVRDLCQRWKIPLHFEQVDLTADAYSGMSTEEAARTARYKVFGRYLKAQGGKIALGHHMDDQAETVLLNLFRGSGAQGLKGMLPQRESYIRPLLCVNKSWIVNYCHINNLDYVMDESNQDVTFTRNRLRQEIMPLIERKVQPKLSEHISRTAQLLREEDSYLRELAIEAASQVIDAEACEVVLHNDRLIKLSLVLQRRVLRLAMEQSMGHIQDLTFDHVEQMLALIKLGKTGKIIHLPKGWQMRTDYALSFIERVNTSLSEIDLGTSIDLLSLKVDKTMDVVGYRLRLLEGVNPGDYPQNVYTKWFDYDKIGTNLNLRTRRPGDWLRLGEDLHRKKLKNYLIDAKISRPERDKMILLAQNDEIIWVVGHRMNAYYKVKDTTSVVLEVSLIKEEQQ